MSKMTVVICLLLIIWSWIGILQGVHGRIVDERGDALEGVLITDLRQVAYSDQSGEFYLNTTADSLLISRPGFSSQTVSVQAAELHIVMDQNTYVLPSVWVRAVRYQPVSPSLGADLVHPDTNSSVTTPGDLLLKKSTFTSNDLRLSGERQTVSLLGSFNRHSLVLVDGVVQNASGEAFDFTKLPVGQIASIEIIKGNASVYGGSAAIGGIIHIHTRDAVNGADWEVESLGEIGAFDLYRQHYRTYLRLGGFTLNTDYSHQDAFNDYSYQAPTFWGEDSSFKRKHNRKQADSFFAKASYSTPATQYEYALNAGSFVRELPGPITFLDLYDKSRLTGSYLRHNLRSIRTGETSRIEFIGWWNVDHSRYKNLQSSNPIARSHYTQDQLNRGVSGSSSWDLEDMNLNCFVEYQNNEYEYNNVLNSAITRGNRDNSAMSLRAGKTLYPAYLIWRNNLAIRADYSGQSLHPTWRLEQEIEFPWGEQSKLGAYVGTAFSHPSLFDMYWIGDSETQGNPDLQSENSFGYSLYSSYSSSGLELKAAYYHNEVENLIQWRQYFLFGVSWRPFNVGRAEIDNIELEANLRALEWLQLSANCTKTWARDFSLNADSSPAPSYGKHLVYTPDFKAVFAVRAGDEQKALQLRYSYTGEQYSTPDNLIEPLPAFDNLDGEVSYAVLLGRLRLQSSLKLSNILDRKYEIYANIPQPGFHWSVGLQLSLGSGSLESY